MMCALIICVHTHIVPVVQQEKAHQQKALCNVVKLADTGLSGASPQGVLKRLHNVEKHHCGDDQRPCGELENDVKLKIGFDQLKFRFTTCRE